MKICYALLLHHKFDQAVQLIRRLAAPGVSFAIHLDRNVQAQDIERFKSELADIPNIGYARRVRARWGSFDQAVAVMRVVQHAASNGAEFDRCVLMSGQDYPIASHAQIVEFFNAHPTQEFIEAQPLDVFDATTQGWTPHYRFRRVHVWLGRRRFALPVLLRRPPPTQIFHGATWWALTAEAVRYVAERFEADIALRRYLRTGFLVDEVYVPTLLMNSRFADRVTHENLTFAQWAGAIAAHPKTLGVEDLADLRASRKLFARKFDAAQDDSVMRHLDAAHATKPPVTEPTRFA